jgi:hypothetical protein
MLPAIIFEDKGQTVGKLSRDNHLIWQNSFNPCAIAVFEQQIKANKNPMEVEVRG